MKILHVMPASAPCRAVLLTLKQINSPVELREVNPAEQEHLSEEFARMNPMRCVPTLQTERGPLWESRSIMRYLCDEAGADELYPRDPFIRAHVNRVLDWDASTLYPAVAGLVYPAVFGGLEVPMVAWDNLAQVLGQLEDQLVGHDGFLVGDRPTIGDISVVMALGVLDLLAPADPAPMRESVFKEYPSIRRWREAVEGLKGWAEIQEPFDHWRNSFVEPEPPADGAVESTPPERAVEVRIPAAQ